MHTEIRVKANVWVDEGVAALVSALNEFEDIQTLESCEGGSEAHASVYFLHRRGGQETFAFVQRLSGLLESRLEACCEYRFRLEWMPGNNKPLAEILARREYVDTLAGALATVAANEPHTTQFADGR